MRAKLGPARREHDDDRALIDDLLRADGRRPRRLHDHLPPPRALAPTARHARCATSSSTATPSTPGPALPRAAGAGEQRRRRARGGAMNRVNPKFVLRNHLAEAAIDSARSRATSPKRSGCCKFWSVRSTNSPSTRPMPTSRRTGPARSKCPVHHEATSLRCAAAARAPWPSHATALMKLLFDFLPIILFFVAFKFADANKDAAAVFATSHLGFLVSGGVVGAEEAPVLLATVVVIIATLAQVAVLKAARRKKVDTDAVGQPGAGRGARRRRRSGSTARPSSSGSRAAVLGDGRWPCWLSPAAVRQEPAAAAAGRAAAAAASVWQRLNLAWVAFFAVMGAAQPVGGLHLLDRHLGQLQAVRRPWA